MKHLTKWKAWLALVATLLAGSLLAHSYELSPDEETLTEQLLAEDPALLIEAARKDGDIVRGAILYHQGNINCAKCHRPAASEQRIGPDLSQLADDVTDAHIVESILAPSKVIREGYETKVILTLDGDTITGTVVDESDDRIVLRDIDNVDRLITVERETIEQERAGRKSSMPDGLADELRDRRQFLDLLRYVLDVRERGPSAGLNPVVSNSRRTLEPGLQGAVLVQELNCAACHEGISSVAGVMPKQAPDLSWSGRQLNPQYIQRFIAEPHLTKPGTTMPVMLGHLADSDRKRAAEAITHYLVSSGNDYRLDSPQADSIAQGMELFHSVGCVACHSPRDEFGKEQPMADSIALGDISDKYSVDALVAFLEDPLEVRPSGHMPDMQLTHYEAIDIASYLIQVPERAIQVWVTDEELAAEGRELFVELRCIACHADPGGRVNPVSPAMAMQDLNIGRGCLAGDDVDRARGVPDFELASEQVEEVQAALEDWPTDLNNEQQIEISLAAFNCIACHDRGDFGGVTDLRNPHFQTTNLNLGDQGRIPPSLTGAGAKLKSEWMRDVLVNDRSARPYMKTRMPQFGEDNVSHLIELFQQSDSLEETEFAFFEDQKEMRKLGLEIAGNQGLNCVACHTYKYEISDTMPAVDLTEMADRLKKDWFYQYMLEPQRFSPNTVMPSFWPGGQSIREDIQGDARYQVEALWQYLIDGRQAGAPRGVVREPIEIVVADEAQMLRRAYPGIGKRGIGVGYPGGVNIAFDAEQMRLGLVWNGRFADPAGVWRGQGSGRVRPMGRPVEFTPGPDLDNADNPWVVNDGRPPEHQFAGYSLDELRRPAFRYQFGNVEVEEFFYSVADETDGSVLLRREIKLNCPDDRAGLRFRIASGAVSGSDSRTFSVGDQLKVNIVSEHEATVVSSSEQSAAEITFDLSAGEQMSFVIDYSWE
ncbi:MAG: hypothetical protein AAF456_13195 [Planctomycetota bacterium]